MAFEARVFRVLIASPSDVLDEREIAVKTIQEWNDLHSAERRIVLLPLRWETHSAPEYGDRPQEIINRQIVDHADLLLGIFWTRIGTPTGVADSGTLEEIEKLADEGRPVMLYFSQAKQDPDRLDLDQLQRLRAFKSKTFPHALVESYSTQVEFRDKLARQIEIQVRSLIAAGADDGSGAAPKPATDIRLEFADTQSGVPLGARLVLDSVNLEVVGADEVPDYAPPQKDETRQRLADLVTNIDSPNRDYYRQAVAYAIRRSYFRPVRFWWKNVGVLGARDVYVEVRILGSQEEVTVSTSRAAGLSEPKKFLSRFFGGSFDEWNSERSQQPPTHHGSYWSLAFEIRALQPQREISPIVDLVMGVRTTRLVTLTASIYADTLPQPLVRTLEIDWTVRDEVLEAQRILASV